MKNIINLLEDNKGIIFDKSNTLSERRIHLDCGRKYFTKDWIIKLIDYMNFLGLNTLTLHFSENMGFRIETNNYPEILSDKYLTKDEIREIISYAKNKNIEIMPSLDTPGHVRQILKAFPQYGQEDKYGNNSKEALSITSEEALNFIKNLYSEYADLFHESRCFHIGGDEFMEFEKQDFLENYISVLDDFAKEKFGDEYSWKDTFANYINEVAKFILEKGFTPRVWNDGLYYGEHNEELKQKIKINPKIEVDFWCQMPWNPSISKLATIIEKGHKIYNLNSSYFYYVLRVDKPDDGRNFNSFDKYNQDINIFENWTPGEFFGNRIEDNHSAINGSAMSIWCDNPDIVSETQIFDDIKKELFAFALKCLDFKINEKISFDDAYSILEKNWIKVNN